MLVVVQRGDWSEREARAYAVADNRTGELAEWDLEGLSQALQEGKVDPGEMVGWEDEELAALLEAEWEGEGEEQEKSPEVDHGRYQALVEAAEAVVVYFRKGSEARGLIQALKKALEDVRGG